MIQHRVDTSFVRFLTCLSIMFLACNALYEDQVGKFDWRQQFIGKVKFVHIDLAIAGTHKFIVATEENVLACLSTRTGSIIWRQILEKGESGTINAVSAEGELITVNGNGHFIRSWDSNSGILQWETSIPNMHAVDDEIVKFSVNSEDKEVIMVEMHPKSHAKVVIYSLTKSSMKTSDIISAPWLEASSNCDFITTSYFLCVDSRLQLLYLLPLVESGSFLIVSLKTFGIQISRDLENIKIIAFPYQSASEKPFFALQLGNDSVIFQIQPPGIKLQKILPGAFRLTAVVIDSKLVLFSFIPNENGYKILSIQPDSWTEVSALEGNFRLPQHHGNPELAFVLPYTKKDQGTSYKLLLSTEDHALLVIHQQGRIVWYREEALANIITAEILDLPLSEMDANIEQEFGDIEASVITMLLTRLKTQTYQLQTFMFQSLAGFQSATDDIEGDGEIVLMRDRFGLHKVIVAITSPGKVYGIDSLTGHIVWSHYEMNLSPFIQLGTRKLPLFIQRTTAHFPYPPQCTVLGRHKNTKNTHIFSFDPITGRAIDSQVLPFAIQQATTLGVTDSQHLRGILLLDVDEKVHIYPESALSVLEEYKDVHFIFTANSASGTVTGYSLAYSNYLPLQTTEVWKVVLPQSVIHVAAKRPLEHVHSQGRVMGDRSVLYKYLNPNLAAIFTEGNEPTQKTFFNIYLIDTVTGLIVYSASHKRSKTPINVVHSENWVVYSYYNEKFRRVEVSSIELYEGKYQSNTTAFSSFAPPLLPLVEHQTFIFPSSVETMTDTVTERGMTSKHLLIALPTGGILELPKAFLDPRRPVNPAPEHREEGLIPYIPELPIMSEGIINYNQSVMRISGIQTAPSGLESTCLVFAYGIDLFYTRVTPSKTFDILKDDFDHLLISAVLLGLLLLSYTTKKLAARKSLRAAWK